MTKPALTPEQLEKAIDFISNGSKHAGLFGGFAILKYIDSGDQGNELFDEAINYALEVDK